MRYFEIKPDVNDPEPITGNEIVVSHKAMFREAMYTDTKLSTDQFLRLSALMNKYEKLGVGDVLAIEDQDYELVQKKVEAYVANCRGFAIGMPRFASLISYLRDLPKENPNGDNK